ncbi:NLR family CARD domain-containing protein 3-like [Carassius auratus]|uniref:NLR family CARD domain-containing protein 3-like n=1 Tax=Carassius auratus TaxID=7957 RepID=A0A6P6J3E4_CARAU|nr:NLR family CARD domain-containing protein 3-like [Carassius auratus]
MKSDRSMRHQILFSLGDTSTDLSQKHKGPQSHTAKKNIIDSIFKELEHKIISELKSFKKLLRPDKPECFERDRYDDEGHNKVREGLLKITLLMLRKMNQTDLANTLQTKLMPVYQQKLRSRLQDKYQRLSEGLSNHGDSTRLNEIYTELYITEGGSGEVNNEHEVRQIEIVSKRTETQETPINCSDIFKPSPGQDKPIRTVLTKGVAGIGKTVSVQKFILDWTEGKANQDVHLIFPLPFRELNLIQKHTSLVDLINHLHPESKKLKLADYEKNKVMFIFDGLDECRFRLDFQNNRSLSDVTESASMDVLLTNLIKGNLLPSALLWITSRPAAANQIPPECVHQVTEVRGFNDPQKEEYFRKKINDPSLADKIVAHIQSSRSLFIMCHIPVFCWISAAVLERMMAQAESAEIPKTLTQMFTHFLIFQTKLKIQKYDGKSEIDPDHARKTILSLGKLAFEQLEKGNLIFYEEDLKESGIDVKEVTVYSGVCTQIFREESGLQLGKVFSFVHLSIQEFLAALFKLMSFSEQNTGLWNEFRSPMSSLLKREVDNALQSENGHWDLFLRFLLGLSLESNQTLLQGVLRKTVSSSDINQETAAYIKQKIKENRSPEKSINLFHCLNELNDRSLEQEVQTYLSRKSLSLWSLSGVNLSAAQWSALVFVLLNSEEELDEFKLRKYDRSEECLLRLLPVIKASRKIDLSSCRITQKGCAALSSALRSNPSHLRELDLSCTTPGDSGVKLLSALLEDPHSWNLLCLLNLQIRHGLRSLPIRHCYPSLQICPGGLPLLHPVPILHPPPGNPQSPPSASSCPPIPPLLTITEVYAHCRQLWSLHPARDTHSLCVVCLGAEHAESALEGADYLHCKRLPLRMLRSRRALFEEGAFTSVPHGAGPASVEAEQQLHSWSLHLDLVEGMQMGKSLSSSSPARSSARSLGSEARFGATSPRESDATLHLSASEEVNVESVDDSPSQSSQYEELLKVVTHTVAKLNIDWPAEKKI